MKYFLAVCTALLLLTAPSISKGADCNKIDYQTLCKADDSCTWDSKKHKCKAKVTNIMGCSSHAEFYCAPNGCVWDDEKRKCTEKKQQSLSPSKKGAD
jgi:hypothetical protein